VFCLEVMVGRPIRFISFIADRPSLESPPWTGPILEVEESANALLQTCVKVHYGIALARASIANLSLAICLANV
jgi:hypothetical protein